MELTEEVLDAASPRALDRGRRRAAAGTFVAVLLHEANFHRFDGPVPDLGATAEIVSGGLLAWETLMNHRTSQRLVQELRRRSRGRGDGPVGPAVFRIDPAEAVEESRLWGNSSGSLWVGSPSIQSTHRKGWLSWTCDYSACDPSPARIARISTYLHGDVGSCSYDSTFLVDRPIGRISNDEPKVRPQARAGQATVRCRRCGVRDVALGVVFPRTEGEILAFGKTREVLT